MSLAIAVMIAASSVRSSARRAGQPRGRQAHVGHGVHRVRGRAAVAQREQPAPGVEPLAQRRGGGGSSSRPSLERLRAQLGRSPPPSSAPTGARRRAPRPGRSPTRPGTDRGSSTRRCRAPAGPRGPRAGRGARRTRAPAPTAGGRRSRPAPGARTGRPPGGSSSHSAPQAPNATVRHPRSRAARHRAGLVRPRRPSRCPRGSAASSSWRRERPALGRQAERGQRALAHDHRVHELHGHVAGVRARLRRGAERQQPPAAREALGHPVAQLGEPLRLGLEEAPFASTRCEQLVDPRRRAAGAVPAPPVTPAPAPAAPLPPASRGTPRPPRRSRAHLSSASRRGSPARCCRGACPRRSRGGAAGRSC